MNIRRLLPVLLFALRIPCLFAQGNDALPGEAGDAAAAERYLLWAEQALAGGRRKEALAALERAADFSGVSSDISFLLARVRRQEGKPRGAVLEALGRALEAGRWQRYSAGDARLLEAEELIALRNYAGALAALAGVPDNADSAALRLAALRGLPDMPEFRRLMAEALDRYPRDPRPAKIFFSYTRNGIPGQDEQALMDTVLKRLPFLLDSDPELAWMAAPFMRDTEEARRLVSAYRAGNFSPQTAENPASGPGGLPAGGEGLREFRPSPASLPVSLNLGLIGDAGAVEELFAPQGAAETALDRDLVTGVSGLLRSAEGRDRFAEKLLGFSGLVTGDDDGDGFPETRCVYREGLVRDLYYDPDQDGLAELYISFNAGGVPLLAEQVILPDPQGAGKDPAPDGKPASSAAGRPGLPVRNEDRTRALVFWESYPAVLRTELAGVTYIPRPGDFRFAPIRFVELGASPRYSGLLYPRAESLYPRISRRSLVSFSVVIRRPSAEFEGAVEWIDLDRGVPLRATEILDGRPVSVTEFVQGRPLLQRVDLDLDSRMETLRHFRPVSGAISGGGEEDTPLDYRRVIGFTESDWNGDGVFETSEEYREDGSIVYSWDMDEDGIREYSETRTDKQDR
jgi:tetratricopeptide (TPR) repeat protein